MVVLAIWAAMTAAYPTSDSWLEYEDEFGDRPLLEPGTLADDEAPTETCCADDAVQLDERVTDTRTCATGARRLLPSRLTLAARWRFASAQTEADARSDDRSLRNRDVDETSWTIVATLRWIGEPARCSFAGVP